MGSAAPRWRAAYVGAGAVLALCCGAPAPAGRSPAPRPADVPREVVPLPVQADVYIDVSASMAGFDRQPGGPLDALLNELKASLLVHGVTTYQAIPFGTTLQARRAVSGPPEVLTWPATAADTCLGLPLDAARSSEDRDHREVIDILVTDGVPSAKASVCGATCGTDDVTCVAEVLGNYVKAGRSLWALGFRVPFRGAYWPVQGPRIQIPAGAVRPVHVWLGTSDTRLGRGTVMRLLEWAARTNTESVAVEVWPGRRAGWTIGPGAPGWSAAIFRPAAGELPVCQKQANLSVVALPSAPPLQLTLRKTKGSGAGVWAGRLPWLETGEPEWNRGLRSLLLVQAPLRDLKRDLSITGATLVDWDRTSRAVCLRMTSPSAEMSLVWTVGRDPDTRALLEEWSTTDDRLPSEIGKTHSLARLWDIVADLLERHAGRNATTHLLRIVVQ
jgi:hypothetical protein